MDTEQGQGGGPDVTKDGHLLAGMMEMTQPEAGAPVGEEMTRQLERWEQTLMSQEYQAKGFGADLVELTSEARGMVMVFPTKSTMQQHVCLPCKSGQQ